MSGSGNPYGGVALRRGALAYLAGRAVSALLTFSAFTLAARVLPLDAYGTYMAALAAMETGLAFSTPGLDWVTARILPEYRMHAAGRAIVSIICRLAGIQMAFYSCAGMMLYFDAEQVASLLRMEAAAPVLSLAGAVLAVEGFGRLYREQMLGALMRQGAAQSAQVVRSGTLAFLLASDWFAGREIAALDAVRYELMAACGSTALGAVLLLRETWSLRHRVAPSGDWTPPRRKQLFKLAVNTYVSYLLAFAYGSQMLTLIVARILGADAAAVFGFSTNFSDQVRRYLPTDLLRSVIQPTLIAFFSRRRDFGGFMLRVGLWFKSSMVLLMPVVLYFIVFGGMGATLVGGERFQEAGSVIALMLVGTALTILRRVVELSCNVVLATDLYVRWGFWLLAVPAVAVFLLTSGGSLTELIVLIIAAEAFFNFGIILALRRRGYPFELAWGGMLRLAAWYGVGVGALVWSGPLIRFDMPTSIAVCLLLGVVGTLVAKPLSAAEGTLVSDWSPRGARLLSRIPAA
ncbi:MULTISPECIES: lipopolysaccharide biosynthesis protein [unclassified Methylococcus]|uniref:lipopolysaccharide biosynthesis protein n=1 Tax=unclassified Methylococcus TaxID=2618889 RepID=UPI003D7DC09B